MVDYKKKKKTAISANVFEGSVEGKGRKELKILRERWERRIQKK